MFHLDLGGQASFMSAISLLPLLKSSFVLLEGVGCVGQEGHPGNSCLQSAARDGADRHGGCHDTPSEASRLADGQGNAGRYGISEDADRFRQGQGVV